MAEEALARILTDRQLLGAGEISNWLRQAEDTGVFFEEVLIRENLFSRAQLVEILENHYFCPSADLHNWRFDASLLALIPSALAKRYLVFPVASNENQLQVLLAHPDDQRACEAVQMSSRRQLMKFVGLRHELRQAIDQHYGRFQKEISPSSAATKRTTTTATSKGKAPDNSNRAKLLDFTSKQPVAIVDAIIEAAARWDASDIHLQPAEHDLAVRLRMDGILHTVGRVPKEFAAGVTSRIKVLAEMDVAERRLPQDGRCTIRKGQQVFDLRISCLPSQFGEKIVIRLLSKNIGLLNLDNLQMPAGILKYYQEVVNQPQGFFLVTGPTGSGKTTTLYATLNEIDRESVNVVTLEDPIEYSLDKITQVEIHDDIGLSFAAGLRSILRQDPDVILVGEMRDLETVTIACRSALTGHKVLSTLHTNDTAQAITRLLDMGTAPYLITATLRGVLAQRLVRRICQKCREVRPMNETEWTLLGYPKTKEVYCGKGCDHCGHSGFKGRLAIFEYMRIDDHMHRLILDRASPYTIRHHAQRQGMILMSEFAKRAVLEGKTTVPEIQRAVLSEESKEQLCQNCQRVVNLEFTVCPFCKHVLKEKCQGCGNPVEASWEACPVCGEEVDREWKKLTCRSCLAPVDAVWEKCPYCGGEVH